MCKLSWFTVLSELLTQLETTNKIRDKDAVLAFLTLQSNHNCCCNSTSVKSCFLSPSTCMYPGEDRFRCAYLQTKNREDLYWGRANWTGAAHTIQYNHRWLQSDVPSSYTNICVASECTEQVARSRPFINAWWQMSTSWVDWKCFTSLDWGYIHTFWFHELPGSFSHKQD